jgi:2-keto-4-pentenoate hydratase/2-oxohepta-3-ene-1,7-dioic acid hydratase in catechol pathway
MGRIGIIVSTLVLLFAATAAAAGSPLDDCIAERAGVRVARVLDPAGRVVYARVVAQREGHVTRAVAIADANTRLVEVFERASAGDGDADAFAVSDDRVCAVVDLPQAELDDESRVIVSTGLNFAAHADEAGGGEVFLFPKPASPTSPYSRVGAPAGVLLFDYEVELAFVLFEDVDLMEPPSREALLAKSAFFISNDLSDREAIIKNASLSGPGTGFVEGKGQPGFLPAGPWMVRGTDLFAAVEACGGDGLGLRLSVDSGEGAELRQSASTALMIIQSWDLIGYIAEWIEARGRRTPMPFSRNGEQRFYPLAIGDRNPMLTAGSILQTGTPEGVALNAPGPLGVTLRGLLRLRSPFEQFLVEERARVVAGGTRYLEAGDHVIAQIDGLGAQEFEIAEAGSPPEMQACSRP